MHLLMNNYIHKLRFRLDSDAPLKFIEKFKTLKERIEIGDNSNFSLMIKKHCELESNKNLPILNRTEGGLGGNNNKIHKQIRYKLKHFYKNENDIVLNVFNSDNIDMDIEKWTYEELDDIINSFISVLNLYMGTECINGCIELVNKSMFIE